MKIYLNLAVEYEVFLITNNKDTNVVKSIMPCIYMRKKPT